MPSRPTSALLPPNPPSSSISFLRDPKSTPSLSQLLQNLSNLCLRLRLNFTCPHAPVLADSVRRHLINPLRLHVIQNSTAAHNSSALNFSYDYHHTTQVVLDLLHSFLPDPPSNPHFLHLSAVYDAFYNALHAYSPTCHSFQVLRSIWADLLSILRRQLRLWLNQSLCPELLDQFFIDISTNPPIVNEHQLPSFIPPPVANMILFAGTATKCNLILSSNSDSTSTSRIGPLHLDADDTISHLQQHPISAALTIQSATTRWRDKAANHLSSLLPFSDIASRLIYLREYLLLANPLYWHLFFERLRSTRLHLPTPHDGTLLSGEELSDAERALNHLLATVSSDMHHNVDSSLPIDPPFSLHLSPTATLTPRFSLSYHETPVLASRAPVYCDLFSLTFAVRRAVSELRAAFTHLLYLRRGVRLRSRTAILLVPLLELRRRMSVFLDALEWYVQADVLHPKFSMLHDRLDEQVNNPSGEFFDEFCCEHEHAVDIAVAQCFLNDEHVQTRLNAIFAACVAFADFVQELDSVDDVGGALREMTSVVSEEFERNVDLFVQMLLHSQKGIAESKVHALLLRLNFNRFEAF